MMKTEVRYCPGPNAVQRMTNKELKEFFLIDCLFRPEELYLNYCDNDRLIVGSAVPVSKSIKLSLPDFLISDYFLENRELAVVNIGNSGIVKVNNEEFSLNLKDVLYIGKGNQNIEFTSIDSKNPALFYMASYPAHAEYENQLLKYEDAKVYGYGDKKSANERKIKVFLGQDTGQSCQLSLGITELLPGSIWNTMPSHTHLTRSEVYFYFDLNPDEMVFHFMGQPGQTKHITMFNKQAVISPPWSVHFGAGTRNYSFIWIMGGEDKKGFNINQIKSSDL